jgi:hypothetical protein
VVKGRQHQVAWQHRLAMLRGAHLQQGGWGRQTTNYVLVFCRSGWVLAVCAQLKWYGACYWYSVCMQHWAVHTSKVRCKSICQALVPPKSQVGTLCSASRPLPQTLHGHQCRGVMPRQALLACVCQQLGVMEVFASHPLATHYSNQQCWRCCSASAAQDMFNQSRMTY